MDVMLNTLKWGDKYDSHYVNRLYTLLCKNLDVPFVLRVWTDNTKGITNECEFRDIQDLRPYDTDRVFTYEKLMLIDTDEADVNGWLDLDIHINDNITKLVERPHPNITFIWNYWNSFEDMSLKPYGKGSSCHVNSSFVFWDKGKASWLREYTEQNWDKIAWTYKSLDKYLFYQHARNDRLSFWGEGLFSNYNVNGLSGLVTLFNTSHLYTNKIHYVKKHFELHETDLFMAV